MSTTTEKYQRKYKKLIATYNVPMTLEMKQELSELKNYFNINDWIRDLIQTHINDLRASKPKSS